MFALVASWMNRKTMPIQPGFVYPRLLVEAAYNVGVPDEVGKWASVLYVVTELMRVGVIQANHTVGTRLYPAMFASK